MTFFLRKHIAKLVAGFITLTMFGCSAQNYFDSGNYELAIEKAIKQLNRNPSNIESIDMINSAFNKANENDLLIVLSGSGNSANVINALKIGNKLKMRTIAVIGFNGGKCLQIANKNVHFKINDMQICEDLQLVVMHMCMQKLSKIKLK